MPAKPREGGWSYFYFYAPVVELQFGDIIDVSNEGEKRKRVKVDSIRTSRRGNYIYVNNAYRYDRIGTACHAVKREVTGG